MDAGQKWVGAISGNEPPLAQPWNGRRPSVTLPPPRAARHPPRRATRQSWSARDQLIFIARRLLFKNSTLRKRSGRESAMARIVIVAGTDAGQDVAAALSAAGHQIVRAESLSSPAVAAQGDVIFIEPW